jgi:hypothetical protein
MKALAIVALILALGSIGASVYAKVETHGNYKYMKETIETKGPQTQFDQPLLDSYTDTLKQLHLAAWGAGALAIILGAIAVSKRKGPIPMSAIVLGVAGAALTVLSAPPWA